MSLCLHLLTLWLHCNHTLWVHRMLRCTLSFPSLKGGLNLAWYYHFFWRLHPEMPCALHNAIKCFYYCLVHMSIHENQHKTLHTRCIQKTVNAVFLSHYTPAPTLLVIKPQDWLCSIWPVFPGDVSSWFLAMTLLL